MADAITKALKDHGWTAIPFPNSSFRLLTLVFERRGARGHSNDFEYLAPGLAPRLLPEDVDQVPDLSGLRSGSLDISVGLSLLSGLISALGGGTLGLKAGFKNASKVTYAYSGLSGQLISPVGLETGLKEFGLPESGTLLRQWLDDNLYVATGVLYARKISIEATKSNGQEAGLDVPVIANAASGNVTVKAENESQSKVVFESDRPAPIALQLYKVVNKSQRLGLSAIKQGTTQIKTLPDTNEQVTEDIPFYIDPLAGPATDDTPTPVVLDWNHDA